MTRFLNTKGRSNVAIAICDRCHLKFPIGELSSDPNFPGLRVCKNDLDEFDPWRKAPRQSEDITLTYPRPDVNVTDE